MKKAIAIILTIAVMVLGISYENVAADDGNNGDGLPDVHLPFNSSQG